jgi:hypothetical protein
MKLKYFLRGLGTGILFATLIMFISYGYRNTDARIKEKAKELGMVEGNSETSLSIINTGGSKGEETTNPDSSQNTTSPETTTPEITTQETTTLETKTSEETTTLQDGYINSQTEYQLTISSGMDSSSVSRLLKNAGAIEDANDFDNYLVSNGYAERIRVGIFTIPGGSTYEQIAKLIAN